MLFVELGVGDIWKSDHSSSGGSTPTELSQESLIGKEFSRENQDQHESWFPPIINIKD